MDEYRQKIFFLIRNKERRYGGKLNIIQNKKYVVENAIIENAIIGK